MRIFFTILMATALLAIWTLASRCSAQSIDVAEIRREIRTGFSHAGWKYDRYSELPSLDGNTRMTVADLQGPGVIRHLHITQEG